MSSQSTGGSDHSDDVNEILEIRERCKELRKERDKLRGSQGQSFELIRRLEQHVQTLTEARAEDKNHIQKLESELENCSQEIDYLQDQLNLRTEEVNSLSEHLYSLRLKHANFGNVEEEVARLREELEISNGERLYLLQQLESKELEIEGSALCIERLEESIATVGLEHQFEIEIMKLDLMAQKDANLKEFIYDLKLRIDDAEKVIKSLEKENEHLREQLQATELNAKIFSEKVEEQFHGWLANTEDYTSNKEEDDATSFCGDVLGPLLIKLVANGPSDVNLANKMEKMAGQIKNYESLVKQLKEELRMEKLKAKDEAEELAQEMVELRYQMTGLLDEERKRRAYVERLSLQRIQELEAQVEKERTKSVTEEKRSKSITIFRRVDEA